MTPRIRFHNSPIANSNDPMMDTISDTAKMGKFTFFAIPDTAYIPLKDCCACDKTPQMDF
jgi:hypothetical protein